jgi:hypothetical protein
MALGLADAVAFRISRILEAVFDEIEYRSAKHASARMAKQKEKTERRARKLRPSPYQFQNAPPQRQ